MYTIENSLYDKHCDLVVYKRQNDPGAENWVNQADIDQINAYTVKSCVTFSEWI